MKKGTKGLLIAVGIFTAAGIGLCVAGMSMGATAEGGKIIDQVNRIFHDQSYPGSDLIHLGKGILVLG